MALTTPTSTENAASSKPRTASRAQASETPQSRSPVTKKPTTASSPLTAAPAFSPLYLQIKGLILNSLHLGEWKPGEAIPSEMELAVLYQVSQGTVRKAIDELALENLLVRRQGRGTYVATHAEQQVQFRFLKLVPDTAHHSDNRAQGPAQRQIIDCKRLKAPVDIARPLGLRSGETVLQVRRVLSFANRPTILEDLWLPGTPFKGLTAERLRAYTGPMYAMFEAEFNIRMVRAEEKIRATLPNAVQSMLLKTKQSMPLLSVERIAYTYNDQPMELRRGLYLTDRHYYRNELS